MGFDVFELEVSEGATGDIGGAAAETAAVETAPVEESAAETAAVETPANPLDGVDIDAVRALAEIAPNLLQAFNQRGEQAQPVVAQEGPPELDMFDADSVRNFMAWERQQTLDAIKGMVDPIAEHTAVQQQAEQNALLKDAAHDVEQKNGEFIGDKEAVEFSRTQMLAVARDLFPEVAQRYGMTDRAGDIALERAHGIVKGWQDSVAKHAVEQHVNRNTRLAEQHVEPGAGGSAIEGAPAIYRPGELARKFGGRATALRENAA